MQLFFFSGAETPAFQTTIHDSHEHIDLVPVSIAGRCQHTDSQL